ncbi:MAG: cyclopropane-fatty-acyl-phospholipid synthase, partial [Marinobacter sp.]
MELAKQSGKASLSGQSSLQDYLGELLAKADIRLGGDRPWDMQLHNPGAAERIFTEGSLGLGESYMDGDWDVQALDEFIHRVLRARLQKQVRPVRVLLPYL